MRQLHEGGQHSAWHAVASEIAHRLRDVDVFEHERGVNQIHRLKDLLSVLDVTDVKLQPTGLPDVASRRQVDVTRVDIHAYESLNRR